MSKEDKSTKDETRSGDEPIEVRVTHDHASAKADDKPAVDVSTHITRGRDEERKRITELKKLGKEFDADELADNLIESGGSTDAMRDALLEKKKQEAQTPTVQDIGLNSREVKSYSFMRAVQAVVFPDNKNIQKAAAFEIDCSRAIADQSKAEPQGIFVPLEAQRVLSAGTATDGAELVPTDHLAGSFIDVLRNRSRVIQAGARVLTGLTGDVQIPRKTTGSAAAWIATEGGNAANSEAQFDQVTLTPKTLGNYMEYTRQLLLQSAPSIEAVVRDDLAIAAAIEMDRAALHGSGAAGQPQGIEGATGVNTQSHAALGAPTWAELVGYETSIATDNADADTMAYISNAAMVGHYKSTEKSSGSGRYLMENGEVNGYPILRSNQVAANENFFGDFSQVLIGLFGGLDILVDPYTNSLAGTIRVVMHQSADIALRHGESFTFGSGGV